MDNFSSEGANGLEGFLTLIENNPKDWETASDEQLQQFRELVDKTSLDDLFTIERKHLFASNIVELWAQAARRFPKESDNALKELGYDEKYARAIVDKTMKDDMFDLYHGGRVLKVAWNPVVPHVLASVSSDAVVKIKNVITKVIVANIKPHRPARDCNPLISWSPDGNYLAVVVGNYLSMYSYGHYSTRTTIDMPLRCGVRRYAEIQDVCSIAWAPKGKLIATGHENGHVLVWDFMDRDREARLFRRVVREDGERLAGNAIQAIVWYSNEHIYAFSENASCVRWNVFTGSFDVSIQLDQHPRRTFCGSGSFDKNYMARGVGNDIQIIDHITKKVHRVLKGHHEEVKEVVWCPTNTSILASAAEGQDSTVRLWNVETGDEICQWEREDVCSLSWSADGKYMACSNANSNVLVWEVKLEEVAPVCQFMDFNNAVQVVPSPNGKMLAIWHTDTVTVVDLVRKCKDIQDYCVSMTPSWSPDSNWVALGVADDSFRLWNVRTGDVNIVPSVEHCRRVSWSLQSDKIYCMDINRNISRVDVASRRLEDKVFNCVIMCVDMLLPVFEDGKLLAVDYTNHGGLNVTIRITNVYTKKLVYACNWESLFRTTRATYLRAIQLSNDGRNGAIITNLGNVLLFNRFDGTFHWVGDNNSVKYDKVQFCPTNSNLIAARTSHGEIHIFHHTSHRVMKTITGNQQQRMVGTMYFGWLGEDRIFFQSGQNEVTIVRVNASKSEQKRSSCTFQLEDLIGMLSNGCYREFGEKSKYVNSRTLTNEKLYHQSWSFPTQDAVDPRYLQMLDCERRGWYRSTPPPVSLEFAKTLLDKYPEDRIGPDSAIGHLITAKQFGHRELVVIEESPFAKFIEEILYDTKRTAYQVGKEIVLPNLDNMEIDHRSFHTIQVAQTPLWQYLVDQQRVVCVLREPKSEDTDMVVDKIQEESGIVDDKDYYEFGIFQELQFINASKQIAEEQWENITCKERNQTVLWYVSILQKCREDNMHRVLKRINKLLPKTKEKPVNEVLDGIDTTRMPMTEIQKTLYAEFRKMYKDENWIMMRRYSYSLESKLRHVFESTKRHQ